MARLGDSDDDVRAQAVMVLVAPTPTERCMQNLNFCAEVRPSTALFIRKKLQVGAIKA
jgi:hypothetical protein